LNMSSTAAQQDLTDVAATNGNHTQQNAWSGPGPAAFDFRSTSPHSLNPFHAKY